MKKHIEILENWLKGADEFFNEKYGEIVARKDRADDGIGERLTNHEIIKFDEAGTVKSYIKIRHKRLAKMKKGKKMPERILKGIENLPNLETTHPNLLR